MPVAKTSKKEFIELFEKHGATKTAELLDMSLRAVFGRRSRLEKEMSRSIRTPNEIHSVAPEIKGRIQTKLLDGIVLVGSDCHYWPHHISTAHKAFVAFCRKYRPKIVVLNGDILDGATISRHASIGWEDKPTLIDEIETCAERLAEIEAECPNAKLYWPLGNHDARFETRLATVAPEFAKVRGVHLKDHFPFWEPCWSVWINDNTVIKHRYKGGIHATHNNTVNSGKSIITGHLHSLKVTPFSDLNGTRFGVDTGTMADPYGNQFSDYTEDNSRNHRSGFVLLTFKEGRLLWPEVVHVLEHGLIEFRGELLEVR